MLLFRTLENTRGVAITGEQLAEEVYPSVVFFQDTYHMNIEQILLPGCRNRTVPFLLLRHRPARRSANW